MNRAEIGFRVKFCLSFLVLLMGLSWAGRSSRAETRWAAPEQEKASHQGDPVSLKVVDLALVDFFRVISELSGLNILVDPDVKGSVTLNAVEVPWDQLFDIVLRSQGLQRVIDGNLVRISTRETLHKEEASRQALKRAALMAADTVTTMRSLNYARGKELVVSLQKQLSQRGRIEVDERTNTLIITDIAETVAKIDQLITGLDLPEQQVEIEARIVEVTSQFARQLGTQFGFSGGYRADRFQGALTVLTPREESFSKAQFGTGTLLDTVQLDLIIDAGEQRGDARILSKPRVSTQNNAEALITQGAKIPIPVTQNFTTTVRFEIAALRLTVTPHITGEQTVDLKIRVENNIPDFTRTVLGIPTILTSESRTSVLVPDGGTTVIGGVFVEVDRKNANKIPGLGDIPFLGRLFKRDSQAKETREILFFMTPRILE